ncbi:MAG: HDIG domain-containing protein [Anaerolineae bacterium]
MIPNPLNRKRPFKARRNSPLPGIAGLRALLVGLLFVILSSLILVFPIPLISGDEQLKAGDVAQRDVLAPQRITYVSQIHTEQARAQAEAAVAEVYDPPNTQIARQQVARAREIFDYLESVRADSYASPDEKRQLVAAVEDLTLSENVLDILLNADGNTWSVIKSETISVLNQAMRAEIRPNQLSAARRRVPTLLNLDVSDEAATVIVAIVNDLIQPNTFVNEERTNEERRLARESVQPFVVTYEKDQRILRAGDLVGPDDIEALEALGLQQPAFDLYDLVGDVAFIALAGLVIGLYMLRFRPRFLEQPRYLWLLFLLLLFFVTLVRLMVYGHTILPYLFPMAALSIMLAVLIEVQLSMLVTVLMGLIIGYVAEGTLELTTYAVMGGLVGIFSLGRVDRVNRLLWSGVYVSLMNVAIVVIFRTPINNLDSMGLLQLISAGVANGVFSASLTVLGFFLAGNFLGITTSLQLHELARPTQPLLRQLLLRAPGTYHHSLMVSNLAEQAAERIGADALLTRVGAYYHDVGKTVRPYFFVENQMNGMNVQNRLDPRTSAQIIISHVKDGIELARKHRVPRDVRAFIPEHQGTGLIKYFYHQALEEADDPSLVDEDDFRYPGPKPQSRETAIVMLADSCEAAVRATHPTSVEEIDKVVRRVINEKLTSGELDECDLTTRDLDQIRSAFVEMLHGQFHPRIRYPEGVKEQPGREERATLPLPQPLSAPPAREE